MAGDWIPMRHGLERERETLIVAARLSIRPDFATGLMRRFWCWASDTTTDGFLSGMTFEIIDQQVVDYAGFCEAMSAAGWLVQRSNGVRIPNFDHWLSDSAKARLGEAKRKRLQRMKLPEGPDPPERPGKRPAIVRTNLGQTGQDRTEENRAGRQKNPEKNSEVRSPLPEEGRDPTPDRVVLVPDLPACLPGIEIAGLLAQLGVDEPMRSRLVDAGVTVAQVQDAHAAAKRGEPRRWRSVMIADLQRQLGMKRGGGAAAVGAGMSREAERFGQELSRLRKARGIE